MSNKRQPAGVFGLAAKRGKEAAKKAPGSRVASEEGDKVQFDAEPDAPRPSRKIEPVSPKKPPPPAPESADGIEADLDPSEIRSWKHKDRQLDELVDDPEYDDLIRQIRKTGGVLQSILVRPLEKPDGNIRFEEIFGFKRLNACRTLGIKVRAKIRKLSDREALVIQRSENSGRSNPSAWSRACSYNGFLAEGLVESPEELSALMESDRSTILNLLRVARLMPEKIASDVKLHLLGIEALLRIVSLTSEKNENADQAIERICSSSETLNSYPRKAVQVLKSIQAELDNTTVEKQKKQIITSRGAPAFAITRGKRGATVQLLGGIHKEISNADLENALNTLLKEKGLAD